MKSISADCLQMLSGAAVEALIEEVRLYPKPGLVDPCNNGAHTDMDIHTFIASAHSLAPYFYDAAFLGYSSNTQPPCQLFAQIRKRGLQGEKEMFEATGNINTHKGLVFSMGLLLAAAGYLWRTREKAAPQLLSETIAAMCQNILDDFTSVTPETAKTNGEKLFARHNITGIRGEAYSGYPTVFTLAWPRYAALLKEGASRRKTGLCTLLHIMAHLDDTNVLSRHDFNTLYYVKEKSKEALSLGGPFSEEGFAYIQEMDRDFIQKNISPGGAADMLALTIAVHKLNCI